MMILLLPDKQLLTRRIFGRYGTLNKRKAIQLEKTVKNYYMDLKQIGVEVPPNFLSKVISHEKREYGLAITENFYTKTLESVLPECSKELYMTYIRKVLNTILLISRQNGKFGIDPKPENFGISNNKIIYFDFLPPFINNKKIYWTLVRYDEDQDVMGKIKRYFTPEGILQTLFLRFFPYNPEFCHELRMQMIKMIVRNLTIKKTPFYFVLNSALWNKKDKKSLAEILEIVQDNNGNRDSLRLIFLLLKHLSGKKIEKKEIFRFYRRFKSTKTFPVMKQFIVDELTQAL